jgi:dCMP deaminase
MFWHLVTASVLVQHHPPNLAGDSSFIIQICEAFCQHPMPDSPKSAHSPAPRTRISIPEYAMALAHVASLRSEDPFRKVGAVAFDFDNRVIGTAYNGLAPGFNADHEFWLDRDIRRKFMLHAEVNLCSLFTRGTVKLVATTTKPCTSCAQMLAAYGVKEIYYRDDYPESDADAICRLYGIQLVPLTEYPVVISTLEPVSQPPPSAPVPG